MTSPVAVAEGTTVVGTLAGIDAEVGGVTAGICCAEQAVRRKTMMKNFFIVNNYMSSHHMSLRGR
jgi:hypothetical protein